MSKIIRAHKESLRSANSVELGLCTQEPGEQPTCWMRKHTGRSWQREENWVGGTRSHKQEFYLN